MNMMNEFYKFKFLMNRARVHFKSIFSAKEIEKVTRLDAHWAEYKYLRNAAKTKDEIDEANALFKYDEYHFPYKWAWKYHDINVKTGYDDTFGLNYAIYYGKKMYMPREYDKKKAVGYVRGILMEQDERSPHRYNFEGSMDGAIIADMGGAEGCFILPIIEKIKHAYIFECDDRWIEALNATFSSWKEKVTIIPKYIGNETNDKMITLDDYFKDKSVDYIKADIEGAEMDMLAGGNSHSKLR